MNQKCFSQRLLYIGRFLESAFDGVDCDGVTDVFSRIGKIVDMFDEIAQLALCFEGQIAGEDGALYGGADSVGLCFIEHNFGDMIADCGNIPKKCSGSQYHRLNTGDHGLRQLQITWIAGLGYLWSLDGKSKQIGLTDIDQVIEIFKQTHDVTA